MPCVVISQNIVKNDSLKISPAQVKNVYVGLKQNEANKIKLHDCINTAHELDSIIKQQNKAINEYILKTDKLNESLNQKQNELLEKSVQIASKTPWFKRGIVFLAVGLLSGAYLMK